MYDITIRYNKSFATIESRSIIIIRKWSFSKLLILKIRTQGVVI